MPNPMACLNGQGTRFTPETATQAGHISAEVRRAKLIERARKYEEAKQAQNPNALQIEIQRQIELTEAQLAYADERLMTGKVPDKEAAALMRESRGHMEHLCRLRGIGEPARIRPTNETRGARQALSEPTPISSGPAPTPEANPRH